MTQKLRIMNFMRLPKTFIQTHRLQYKEKGTIEEIYCALLTQRFTEEIKRIVNREIDTILVSQYSDLIIDIFGEEEMMG